MTLTYILIGLNGLIYLLTYHNIFMHDVNYINYVLLYFGLNKLFFQGFYWQVLSSMFLHASLLHLAMNMAVLFQLGHILEKFLGKLRFALYYVLGGILTSCLSLIVIYYKENFVNIVGASGAICVLLGVFTALIKDRESKKGMIISLLAMSFLPIIFGVNIAWESHLFGFILGYLFVKIEYFWRRRKV